MAEWCHDWKTADSSETWYNIAREKQQKKKNFNLIVTSCAQRLSVAVSGKAQTFMRLGPNEIVPFNKNDVTLEWIKQACMTDWVKKWATDSFTMY